MALNTQRYNYKGHDIYVFMSGTDKQSPNSLLHKDENPYSYAIMVDGKVIGNVEPEMWFMKDKATFVLEDGVQLHLDASARIMSEKVVLYADGQKLEPEAKHNRSFDNMRRLADGYDILGSLTDEQFLAIKSLSSPVVYSYGINRAGIMSSPNTALIKELHSDELLKKHDGNLMVAASLYLAQPGDSLAINIGGGSESHPFGVHYDGFETYATWAAIEIKDTHMPTGDRGYSDWIAGSLFEKDFTIDGLITLYPNGAPMQGCFTSVNYLKALDELEETLSQMPEEAREIYERTLKGLINEETTLAEFATIRSLSEQGYELTDQLLMEIAAQDKEWQAAMIQRFFDKPEIEDQSQEQEAPTIGRA